MSTEEKLIEEAAETVRHYFDPVLQTPLNELGLLLRDKISFWRFKNQVNTALRAKEFLVSKGIDLRKQGHKILPEIVIPLLEASGEAVDETISRMFASLLAGSINPESSCFIHPSYAKVLSQLSSLDAQILNSLYAGVIRGMEQTHAQPPSKTLNENVPAHRQFGNTEKNLAAEFTVHH